MLKKLKILVLVAGLCFIIVGCGKTKITTKKISSTAITNTTTSNITTEPAIIVEKPFFVAPNGKDDGEGTVMSPFSLAKALEIMEEGNTIYLLSGTYNFWNGLTLTKQGGQEKVNSLIAVAENVVFDFNWSSGLTIDASYWFLYNIKFCHSNKDGCVVNGRGNTIEQCRSYSNKGNGFRLSGASENNSDNSFLYCIADNNNSTDNRGTSYGFFITGSGMNNELRSCIAYRNDCTGFYIYTAKKVVVDSCVAIENGILYNGYVNVDRGSGFDFSNVNHVFNNCTAYHNTFYGFTSDKEEGTFSLTGCTAIDNRKINYKLANSSLMLLENLLSYSSIEGSTSDIANGQCKNCLFFVRVDFWTIDYYYTGENIVNINTLDSKNRGISISVAAKEAYQIFRTIPNDFEPTRIMTKDGLFLGTLFDRNEAFQVKYVIGGSKIYFGAKYLEATN